MDLPVSSGTRLQRVQYTTNFNYQAAETLIDSCHVGFMIRRILLTSEPGYSTVCPVLRSYVSIFSFTSTLPLS
jgi:hypothetical protein